MRRSLALAITLLVVAGTAMPPVMAQVEGRAAVARTNATANIQQPVTISSSQDLLFVMSMSTVASLKSMMPISSTRPTARSGAGATGATIARSMSSAFAAPARATFQVVGDAGQSISVTMPEEVDLTRVGGAEMATLTTDSSVAGGPQFLGGDFEAGGTLSFDVGGQVTLASADMVPGTYNGVLAVVAQYN